MANVRIAVLARAIFGGILDIRMTAMKKRKAAWPKITRDVLSLGVNAPLVMALRMAKIASGGAVAKRESKRMVDEKLKAASDATVGAARAILTGNADRVQGRTLALYRRRVASNLRRLLKG
jgi:hypothetical protein